MWVERLTEDFSDRARDKIVDEAARREEKSCSSSLSNISFGLCEIDKN